jgi:predicted transcriptional regulator
MAAEIDPRVIALSTQMFSKGLTVSHVLRRAGVPGSTWTRWRQGSDPRRVTLAKVEAAIASILTEKETADGRTSGL